MPECPGIQPDDRCNRWPNNNIFSKTKTQPGGMVLYSGKRCMPFIPPHELRFVVKKSMKGFPCSDIYRPKNTSVTEKNIVGLKAHIFENSNQKVLFTQITTLIAQNLETMINDTDKGFTYNSDILNLQQNFNYMIWLHKKDLFKPLMETHNLGEDTLINIIISYASQYESYYNTKIQDHTAWFPDAFREKKYFETKSFHE